MVETISPVGYGDRTGRWIVAVTLYTLGATATAAAFGAVLGAAGSLVHAPWGTAGVVLVAATAVAYAAREAFGLPVPVPAARRQVPDWWRSFFPWPVAATLYGAGLGIGFLTFLTNGGLVVVAAAALVSGRPATGAVLVGAFGLARGVTALTAWPVRTREAGAALVDRLAARDPAVWRRVNAAALTVVAVAAVAQLVRAGASSWSATVASAAAGMVAVVFAWSGTSKLVAPAVWRRALAAHELPPWLARPASAAVPAVELSVAVAVIVGAPAVGAALALVSSIAFSAVIVRTRLRTGRDHVACGCFGGSRSSDYRLLLARNAVLIAAGAVGLGAPAEHVPWWPGAPGADELLPFGLAASAAGVAVLTAWRSARWLGRGGRV